MFRILSRLASLLLVAGLLLAPAAASAKSGHGAKHKAAARHKAAKKKHRRAAAKMVAVKSADEPTRDEPAGEPEPQEPADEPGDGPGDDPADEPGDDAPGDGDAGDDPPVPPVTQPDEPGVVASFHEGVLDVEWGDTHVRGKVLPGATQFVCRDAATHAAITEGCNASLLTEGRGLHEFAVNYGANGAWFKTIVIVL